MQSQAQVFAAIGCNLTMSKGGQNAKNHNKKMSLFHAYFQILGGFCAEASARFDTLSLSKFDHRQQDVRHCRVTRCRLEFLGSHRSVICSIGDVFGGCTRFCVFSRVFEQPEICAARTSDLEPCTVGKRLN